MEGSMGGVTWISPSGPGSVLVPAPTEEHIYHHYDNDGPRVNVSAEKNTKGYNWSATVTGARSVEEAIALLTDAEAKLAEAFGQPVTG